MAKVHIIGAICAGSARKPIGKLCNVFATFSRRSLKLTLPVHFQWSSQYQSGLGEQGRYLSNTMVASMSKLHLGSL
jgi:hypothetical protein